MDYARNELQECRIVFTICDRIIKLQKLICEDKLKDITDKNMCGLESFFPNYMTPKDWQTLQATTTLTET